ncbi:flagellar protein FlaG [Paenibacillus lautus]|uniref:flagellar protein FlaG n=1 Tax=Paenibacillus TaxID=44249 RepID=UPI00240E7B91|nr:flagellar protein FlaG [Paenibacillus sp. BR1-192]MBY0163242.1 flagellar protein FlaG [Cytobacillus firmus]WFB58167.1 flagellar protein FlaG [Paenibacillus sp. BR1-192]
MEVSNSPVISTPSLRQRTEDPSYSLVGGEHSELANKQKYQRLTVSEQAVLDAINKVNKVLEGAPQKFEYKIHENTGDVIVKIINKDTNLIIREIPPEKLIELVEKLQQLARGAIVDEKR